MDNDYMATLIKNRTILLHNSIDPNSASQVVAQILGMNSINNKPITLHISSSGGCVYSGLQIIDIMNFVASPIYVVAVGLVASMATMIYMNGHPGYRVALPNATFMLHEPSVSSLCGKVSDINLSIEELRRLKTLAEEMIINCTRLRGGLDRDRYLNAFEAVEAGIVDQVLKTTKDKRYNHGNIEGV